MHEPAPATFSRGVANRKHTMIHVTVIMCDKNFKKKAWEAVGAIARNPTSGKVMQNTCGLVACYEGLHSLHMT